MGMGQPASTSVELVSFHTVSKGFLGECGQRGGYLEMTNIDPQVSFLIHICNVSAMCRCSFLSASVMFH